MKLNMKISYALAVAVVLAVVVVVFFGSQMFLIIEAGERGVVFRPYTTGLDKENIYGEGFHVIAPWNKMYVYNVREQQREETMDVLDKNGLVLNVDVTVRFNPVYKKIGDLYQQFGVDYIDVLVIPEVRSTVRQVAGRYSAEEIFSTKRQEVEQTIKSETRQVLDVNYIDMRALLIRSINLPEQIKGAIERKLEEEQKALAYQYRLQSERSEAERMEIEAEGIANYNRIINSSITDKVLKQRGIEATLELAESENTKVIVIGGGEDGLPLILGDK